MTCVYCSLDERYVNPLFEVFDGGDFVLSTYRDVEDKLTTAQLFFPNEADVPAAKAVLKSALDLVGADVELKSRTFPDEDWTLSYRLHFKTEVISPRLAIVPVWEKFVPAEGQHELRLDPGMAFGTGQHETTRTCLEFIDGELAVGDCDTFLDVGCGSGILAVAAKLLGAKDVRGFDLDADSVKVAEETAATNRVEVDFFRGDLSGIMPGNPAIAAANLVAANVLGPVLIRFASQIAALVNPKGKLILSGILEELYPEVKAAYVKLGFRELKAKTIGEWRSGIYEKA